MSNEIYDDMIQPRGAAYRSEQIKSYSHYREPIDHAPGRLAGNSRVWGDASPQVQSRSIDILIEASQRAGLTPRDTAHVLAIARAESGFNPDAASNESAAGLGQFLNRTGSGYGLGNENRFDARENARALVEHFIDNRDLARRRGQDESYVYKYHHDGPTSDSGGLQLSQRNIMPHLDEYERFVQQRLAQQQTAPGPATVRPPGQAPTPADATPAAPQQPQSSTQPHNFQQAMEIMLPPQGGTRPHVTGHAGDVRHARPGIPAHAHGGTDFNYEGGQAGVNMRHPTVHSPVSGTLVIPTGSQYNTVGIRDAQGNVHQILHLDARDPSLRSGQPINAGDPIGTMGNKAPPGNGNMQQHVHYQIVGSNGHKIDPERFWANRTIEAPGRTQESGNSRTAGAGNGGTTAIADGVLKPGERGDDVLGLQRNLNLLGVRDANNRPLGEDGSYGDRTREAITAYQRANHLKVDGQAGPETLGSIGNQLSAGRVATQARIDGPVGITNPAHSDNALYTAIRSRLPDDVPDNVAARATIQAKDNGIDAVAKLRDVTVQDGNAYITGTTPGFRTKVDLTEPAPSMDQINTQLQSKPAAQTLSDPQPQVAMGGR